MCGAYGEKSKGDLLLGHLYFFDADFLVERMKDIKNY